MRLIFLFICLISTCLAEDQLTLKTGEIIRGSIQSISTDNTITLEHIAAEQGLKINALSTDRIDLNITPTKFKKAEALVSFTNGDNLSGQVTSISPNSIRFASQFGKEYTIPRSKIDTLSFGDSISTPLFDLNQSPKIFETSTGWELQNRTLKATSTSMMWQAFDLTPDFIIKFNIAWQSSPNLTLHLGANNTINSTSNPRYIVNFNNRVLNFESINSTQKRGTRTPSVRASTSLTSYKEKEVAVELRVSRSSGNIILFLNGEKIHNAFFDTADSTGNYIGIQNQSRNNAHTISNLHISTWDQQIQRTHKKNSTHTFIALNNGDTLTGKLSSSSQKNNILHYAMNYEHSNENILHPQHDIKIIHFKETASENSTNTELKASLLKGNVKLTLSNISMEKGLIKATHPVLGEISLEKKHFRTLELN